VLGVCGGVTVELTGPNPIGLAHDCSMWYLRLAYCHELTAMELSPSLEISELN